MDHKLRFERKLRKLVALIFALASLLLAGCTERQNNEDSNLDQTMMQFREWRTDFTRLWPIQGNWGEKQRYSTGWLTTV